MSDTASVPGSILWMDLTVTDAERTRHFYEQVVGWKSQGIEMGGYQDYCMNTPDTDQTVAGICHARGENASQPPQWMIYITVPDLAASLRRCVEEGGQILVPAREISGGQMAVIQDPAGAVAGLHQPPPVTEG